MDAYKKVVFLVVVLTAVALTLFSFFKTSYEDLEIKHVQSTPLTQSLNEITVYKFANMHNDYNLANLFYDLPIGDALYTVRLFTNECTVEINYKKPIWDIGEEIVYTSILYNSIVTFALIDNLEYIIFNFVGSSYKVSRHNAEELINNLDSILIEDNFINMQLKLEDYDLVIEYLNKIVV